MPSLNKASIITIGDELLIGQVIDTNSAFIAQQLNKVGIEIKHRVAVGDDFESIWNALENEQKNASIIIITGGLGPTADDITKPLLCKYFNGQMITHEETLEHVKHIFNEILKRPLLDRNLKQAEVPNTCTVLKNEVGTAPGMLFKRNDVLFFSLPGVPHEMKWLMLNKVLPLLQQQNNHTFIEHRTLLTAGVGESFIAEKLVEFEEKLPSSIKLAYLPNYGMVRLRLTGVSNDKNLLQDDIDKHFNLLKSILNNILITDKDESLVEYISNLIANKNESIGIAESCTGGFIAHQFTSLSGSSDIFKGGIVAYSNELKINLLNVNTNDIDTYGAVSKSVVEQMASNILSKLSTTYAVAVSGIMGPTGGTIEKPIGTVWIAVANKNKTISRQLNLKFDRLKNIEVTSLQALLLLRELIVDKH